MGAEFAVTNLWCRICLMPNWYGCRICWVTSSPETKGHHCLKKRNSYTSSIVCLDFLGDKKVNIALPLETEMLGNRFHLEGTKILPIAFLIYYNKSKYVFGGKQCNREQIIQITIKRYEGFLEVESIVYCTVQQILKKIKNSDVI